MHCKLFFILSGYNGTSKHFNVNPNVVWVTLPDVSKIIVHPKFDIKKERNDIALIPVDNVPSRFGTYACIPADKSSSVVNTLGSG